jgi:hypothetical protein
MKRGLLVRVAAALVLALGLTLLALSARLAQDGAWSGLSLAPLGLVLTAGPLLLARQARQRARALRRLGQVRVDVRPPTVLAGAPLQVELAVTPADDVVLAARAVLEGAEVVPLPRPGRLERRRVVVELLPSTLLRAGVEAPLRAELRVPEDAWATRTTPELRVAWGVRFELELEGSPATSAAARRPGGVLTLGPLPVVVVRADPEVAAPR